MTLKLTHPRCANESMSFASIYTHAKFVLNTYHKQKAILKLPWILPWICSTAVLSSIRDNLGRHIVPDPL